ncbi:MAG TPA: KpsF/GutQ family sugar-phosphate isomerase [Kofleriaceae bacterium]|nr:KpsF/GutQ family sugar-phosphate isomerase [Kofleriaceae bacterium]
MIAELADRLDESFALTVEAMLNAAGHVVVMGVGKSGLIGKKIASTFASTGTPSFFVNAAEAHHGDLGMITARDTALLVSHSGETEEVVQLVPHLRRLGITIIALVGQLDSTLARSADVALDVSVHREACPNNLAPTSSALAALAMGDALAVSLMRRRGFGAGDFARFHPGGTLGRRLCTQVRDVMRGNDLPIVAPTDTVGDSLVTMTRGRLGLILVMNGDRLLGLVTDGDLRRAMQRHSDLLRLPVTEIMTRNPVTIDENTLLDDAHQRLQAMKLKALVVVGDEGKVTGIVEVFDEK